MEETSKHGKFQVLKKSLGKTQNDAENIKAPSDVDITNIENEINLDNIDHIKETNFITLNETLEPIFLGHCRKFYGYFLITSWIWAVIGYEAYIIDVSTFVSISDEDYNKKFFIEFSLRKNYQDINGVGIFFGYMLGATTSGIINGIMCDRYGRKTVYTYNSVVHILGSIFQMIPWYPSYIINKFLLGFSSIGILISSFLLIFEYSNSNTRIVAVCFFRCFQSFGALLIFLMGSILHVNWRIRDLVLIPLNFGFVLGIWLLPESKRWEKMMAFEVKLIKILKLIDPTSYKLDRFYKNENFKFPYSYVFLFTRRYLIHFTLILIMFTLLSPQLSWFYRTDYYQRASFNRDWWSIYLFLAIYVPLLCSLAYILLKITKKRKLFLFPLLFLSLFLLCVMLIFIVPTRFYETISGDIFAAISLLIYPICLGTVFIIIVLLIVEESPTKTRGAILGLLMTCQFTIYLVIFVIAIQRMPIDRFEDLIYYLTCTVLSLISLFFVNLSQGVVIVNTWHDLVKSSQEYQPYMY